MSGAGFTSGWFKAGSRDMSVPEWKLITYSQALSLSLAVSSWLTPPPVNFLLSVDAGGSGLYSLGECHGGL